MYNGIGLKTPRGSGTNGYITRNLSFVKPKYGGGNKPYDYDKDAPPPKTRRPNEDVLLHKSKRQIEVECLELRERLEVQKYYPCHIEIISNIVRLDEAEIEKRVKRLRAELQAQLAERLANTKEDVLMEKKEREMSRLKSAFGIGDDFKEGRGFNFETERERQERLARVAEEERHTKRIRRD